MKVYWFDENVTGGLNDTRRERRRRAEHATSWQDAALDGGQQGLLAQ
jgi:hypothetical protein